MRRRRSLAIYRPIRPRRLTRNDAPDRLLWLDAGAGVNARGAAQFGTGNALSIASTAALQLGSGVDVWGAAWAYLTSKAETGRIMAKFEGKREFLLQYDPGPDRIVLLTSSDGEAATLVTTQADSLGSPALNTWYFVLWWLDAAASTQHLRVNALAADSTARPGDIFAFNAPFTVGGTSSGTVNWAGRLDQVAYGKPTPGTIASVIGDIHTGLYNGGSGASYGGLTASQKADWGLTAFYEFDERSGTRADSHGVFDLAEVGSVSGADGVVEGPAGDLDPVFSWDDSVASLEFNNATIASRPSWRSSGYLDFDGVDDRLGHSGVIVGNRHAFTLLARIRLDTMPTTNPAIVYTESDAAGSLANRLAVAPGGNVVASYRPGGGTLASASSDGTLVAGTDAVAAVRRDGSALQVFINGQPSGPPATIGAGTDLAGAMARIGGPVESSGFAHLDGRIYDVFAVGRALSDAQIAGLSA